MHNPDDMVYGFIKNYYEKEIEKLKQDCLERDKKQRVKDILMNDTLTPKHIIDEGYFYDNK